MSSQEKKSYQRERRANTKDKGPGAPPHGDHGNYEGEFPKAQRPESGPNAQRNYNNYSEYFDFVEGFNNCLFLNAEFASISNK